MPPLKALKIFLSKNLLLNLHSPNISRFAFVVLCERKWLGFTNKGISSELLFWILSHIKESQDDNSLTFYSIKNSGLFGKWNPRICFFNYFNNSYLRKSSNKSKKSTVFCSKASDTGYPHSFAMYSLIER
jgi:hypothetical protein